MNIYFLFFSLLYSTSLALIVVCKTLYANVCLTVQAKIKKRLMRIRFYHLIYILGVIRVCGVTGSASARSWEGYGFDALPKLRHS